MPGLSATMGLRASSSNWTGFSSRHTTGSLRSRGFSYRLRTSSILSAYSCVSFAMHHIFFPPRLEGVVAHHDANGFLVRFRHDSPLDCFLGGQAYRPSRTPRG